MPNSGVWLQRRTCSVLGFVRLPHVGWHYLAPEWCLYEATNFLAQQGPQLLSFTCEKSRSLGSENLEDFSWRCCHKVLRRNASVPDGPLLPGKVLHLLERWPSLFLFATFVLVFILRQCLSQVVYLQKIVLNSWSCAFTSPDAGVTGMWDQAWHISAFKCNFLWIPFSPLEFSSGPSYTAVLWNKRSLFSWGEHVVFVCFLKACVSCFSTLLVLDCFVCTPWPVVSSLMSHLQIQSVLSGSQCVVRQSWQKLMPGCLPLLVWLNTKISEVYVLSWVTRVRSRQWKCKLHVLSKFLFI